MWTKFLGPTEENGVLVWIHGGSEFDFPLPLFTQSPNAFPEFIVGGTNTPFYQGQYIMDSQSIVSVPLMSASDCREKLLSLNADCLS